MRISALSIAAALVLLSACGGDDDTSLGGATTTTGEATSPTSTASPLPDECATIPLSMRLEAGGDDVAGGPDQAVSDAVARRVPILPGRATTGVGDLAEAQAEAAETDLALYSLYLADFDIDRTVLTGFGFGEVRPEAGQTIGVLTIVPHTEEGFAVGDVATGAAPEYVANTTFTTLGLTVRGGDNPDALLAYTDVVGQVEILALDDDQICLDIDVEVLHTGELVAAAVGVVAAPVVRSAPEFFFT